MSRNGLSQGLVVKCPCLCTSECIEIFEYCLFQFHPSVGTRSFGRGVSTISFEKGAAIKRRGEAGDVCRQCFRICYRIFGGMPGVYKRNGGIGSDAGAIHLDLGLFSEDVQKVPRRALGNSSKRRISSRPRWRRLNLSFRFPVRIWESSGLLWGWNLFRFKLRIPRVSIPASAYVV